MKKLIKEYRWQKRYYLNGTIKFYLYKLGLTVSPTLMFGGVKPWFKGIWREKPNG